jgi:hypothetical protein
MFFNFNSRFQGWNFIKTERFSVIQEELFM